MGIFDFGKQAEIVILTEKYTDGVYRMVGVDHYEHSENAVNSASAILKDIPESCYSYIDDSPAVSSPDVSPTFYDYPMTSDANGPVPICPNG